MWARLLRAYQIILSISSKRRREGSNSAESEFHVTYHNFIPFSQRRDSAAAAVTSYAGFIASNGRPPSGQAEAAKRKWGRNPNATGARRKKGRREDSH